MPITRTPIFDDTGSGTDGTIINNAWKQELYDQIDGADAGASGEHTVINFYDTGTIHNKTLIGRTRTTLAEWGAGAGVPLQLTGVAGGVIGDRLIIRNSAPAGGGFAPLYLHHNAAGSAAANRFSNFITLAPTPLGAGGSAFYIYNGTAWLLVAHEQGAPIAYTPTLASGTGAFGAATATGRWRIQGNTVQVWQTVTITTNGTAGQSITVALPFGVGAAASAVLAGVEVAATGLFVSGQISAAGITAILRKYDGTYPGATGHTIIVSGQYDIA